MSRLAMSIAQEIEDFQAFITRVMPYGARVTLVDDRFEPGLIIGAPELLVHQAKVLDATLGEHGALYNVCFGRPDLYGPAAYDDADPATQGWTVVVSDPVIDLRDGTYAIEIHNEGQPSGRYVFIGRLTALDIEILDRTGF